MSIVDFIQALAQGFQKSPGYVSVGISILAGFLIFLMIAAVVVKRRQVTANRRLALRLYRDRIRVLDLTINELDFIDSLSGCLDKPWKKYLIVSNENTFHNCCEELKKRKKTACNPAMMQRVGEKAGFLAPAAEKSKEGTINLVPGTPVKLEASTGKIFDARVTETSRDSFVLEGASLPVQDQSLVIHVPHRTGILAFVTHPAEKGSAQRLVLKHSDEIPTRRWGELSARKSNRDFKVFIKIDGSESAPVKTSLYRITRNGAFIENPGGMLTRFRDLRIFFSHHDKPGGIWVNGEVRAESLDRKEVFVKFMHITAEKKS